MPMLLTKFRNTLATAVLLALSAGPVVRLGLWRGDGSAGARPVPEGAARQLKSSWENEFRKDYTKVLISRGHDPESADFRNLLRDEVQARARQLERARVLERLGERRETWLRGDRVRQIEERDGTLGREEEVRAAAEAENAFEEKRSLERLEEDYKPLAVCGRPAAVGSTENFASLQQHMQCQGITKDRPILLIAGGQSHGRTGNNLIEFLHAIQEARDGGIQLGIMRNSWATDLLVKMWIAIEDDGWTSQIERAFCLKIFRDDSELEGWEVFTRDSEDLFKWQSELPLGEYMASQEHSLRTLFSSYNTGTGHDMRNKPAGNMCSGIDAIFGDDAPGAVYSVVHSWSLEGEPGRRLLGNTARKSGCDPAAALDMRPDYVKSILEPLGMMRYPLVFITDGQEPEVLERLLADPDLGPIVRTVPEDACWLGGDLTLGVMSNVFIGNPASTFSGFIAKTRLALGFGHSYLFRARDEGGGWRTVCGDHCVFDRTIMGVMA